MESYFDEVLGEVGANYLQLEVKGFASISAYLDAQEQLMRSQVFRSLNDVADIIEPADRSLGTTEEAEEAAEMFFRGGVLALAVARQLLPHQHFHNLANVDVGFIPSDPTDEYQTKHEKAEAYLAMAAEGAEAAAAYDGLLESWEDELSPQVVYQPYLYRGFGFVMYLVKYRKNLAEVGYLNALLETEETGLDPDTDSEFRKIVGLDKDIADEQ